MLHPISSIRFSESVVKTAARVRARQRLEPPLNAAIILSRKLHPGNYQQNALFPSHSLGRMGAPSWPTRLQTTARSVASATVNRNIFRAGSFRERGNERASAKLRSRGETFSFTSPRSSLSRNGGRRIRARISLRRRRRVVYMRAAGE